MTLTDNPIPRQTCAGCLQTVGTLPSGETRPYVTEVIDRRTPAEVKADRPPALGRFHYCEACAAGRTVRETCAVCGMVANVDPALHAERYGHRPERMGWAS